MIVVIIGIVLLMLNVCACGAVIYQKHRVREREDNLRRRIKRLSDAGMISQQPVTSAASNEPPTASSRYCVSNDNGNVCNNVRPVQGFPSTQSPRFQSTSRSDWDRLGGIVMFQIWTAKDDLYTYI